MEFEIIFAKLVTTTLRTSSLNSANQRSRVFEVRQLDWSTSIRLNQSGLRPSLNPAQILFQPRTYWNEIQTQLNRTHATMPDRIFYTEACASVRNHAVHRPSRNKKAVQLILYWQLICVHVTTTPGTIWKARGISSTRLKYRLMN